MLPVKLAIQIFNSQIAPIILYGSEVWGPFVDNNFSSWDKNSVERGHTRYLTRILVCSYNTSNIMTTGEIGVSPLLVQVIKRLVLYTANCYLHSIVNTALQFEAQNIIMPNFCLFIDKFNFDRIDLLDPERNQLTKIIVTGTGHKT